MGGWKEGRRVQGGRHDRNLRRPKGRGRLAAAHVERLSRKAGRGVCAERGHRGRDLAHWHGYSSRVRPDRHVGRTRLGKSCCFAWRGRWRPRTTTANEWKRDGG